MRYRFARRSFLILSEGSNEFFLIWFQGWVREVVVRLFRAWLVVLIAFLRAKDAYIISEIKYITPMDEVNMEGYFMSVPKTKREEKLKNCCIIY